LGTEFFAQHKIVSAVKILDFVSERMSCIVFRGRRCNIIVLNTHATSKDKRVDSKDSFYEELQLVFGIFPKYSMKILLKDSNQKLGQMIFLDRQ